VCNTDLIVVVDPVNKFLLFKKLGRGMPNVQIDLQKSLMGLLPGQGLLISSSSSLFGTPTPAKWFNREERILYILPITTPPAPRLPSYLPIIQTEMARLCLRTQTGR
jgi:hypothetical protein